MPKGLNWLNKVKPNMVKKNWRDLGIERNGRFIKGKKISGYYLRLYKKGRKSFVIHAKTAWNAFKIMRYFAFKGWDLRA